MSRTARALLPGAAPLLKQRGTSRRGLASCARALLKKSGRIVSRGEPVGCRSGTAAPGCAHVILSVARNPFYHQGSSLVWVLASRASAKPDEGQSLGILRVSVTPW